MWQAVLDRMLRSLLRRGSLSVRYPGGKLVRYGEGEGGPVLVLRDEAAVRRLVLEPQLALGECYMDGGLTVEGDDLHGMFEAIVPNLGGERRAGWLAARQAVHGALRWAGQLNGPRAARANVAHHYDLTPALYDLFLDADRQYSCAYFRDPGVTLDQAQAAKKAHIARKLLIRPGMRVLDIGCGWGGLALTLARDWGARVVGITLSEEQLAVARRRAEEAGLAGRVEFRLQDYREVTEVFDRAIIDQFETDLVGDAGLLGAPPGDL
jgi:cyclopropane-fatty-acyl-phospholipid synthase